MVFLGVDEGWGVRSLLYESGQKIGLEWAKTPDFPLLELSFIQKNLTLPFPQAYKGGKRRIK